MFGFVGVECSILSHFTAGEPGKGSTLRTGRLVVGICTLDRSGIEALLEQGVGGKGHKSRLMNTAIWSIRARKAASVD